MSSLAVRAETETGPGAGSGSAVVARTARTRRRVVVWVLRVLVVVVPLTLWEAAAQERWIDPFLFSRPSAVYDQLVVWLQDGTIVGNVGFTLFNTAAGYLIGGVLGAGFAILFFVVPTLGRIITPYMAMMNAIPRFAFAPLFVVAFGFSILSNIALVVLIVMFVTFFGVSGGLQSTDTGHITWARSLGARTWDEWRHVRLPGLVRWVVASLRATLGLALSAAIVSEFVGTGQGIGYFVARSNNLFQTRGVYAGLVVVLIVAALIDAVLRWAERRWGHWVGK